MVVVAIVDGPQDTSWELTRRALHTAVDWVCYAWPKALNDAAAVGYAGSVRPPDGRGGGILDYPDPTGSTAMLAGRAAGWLAELGDLVVRLLASPGEAVSQARAARTPRSASTLHAAVEKLCHDRPPDREKVARSVIDLGNRAHAWWPPPPKSGQLVEGVTVGQRGNLVETCALCQDPVAGGHQDPIRRIDGAPFHAKSCFYTVWRHRKAKPA